MNFVVEIGVNIDDLVPRREYRRQYLRLGTQLAVNVDVTVVS